MSLNPYYVDANIMMAAAARALGDIEIFVNISEYEQSFMTFDKMTAPRGDRLAWLGGLTSDWSPQQRALGRRASPRLVRASSCACSGHPFR
jgi:NAD(P)H dehydrogenase (quinone)